MSNQKDALNKHWHELVNLPNVLNTAAGTKVKQGKDTGIPAIVVYVSKKVGEVELGAEQVVPKEIEGVPTDVIEIAPKTWTAGKTSISQLPPEDQLRRLGAHTTTLETETKKVMVSQPSGQSDWTAYANLIQDQGHCGSCVAFDVTGVWEAKINIATGQLIKLSESHLFFCAGGYCKYGSVVENLLNRALKGVCLESCLPYSGNVYAGNDEKCAQGICDDWWTGAKKLASWQAVSDSNQILTLLDSGPLVATFQVPQSFMNYTGGIYTRLPNDPIVGRHGVGIFGYNANCFKILRNSWGIDWAQNCNINGKARPGWCMIDPALLDGVMYDITPNGPVDPEPEPPTPQPCKWAGLFTNTVNQVLKITGHSGQITYKQ